MRRNLRFKVALLAAWALLGSGCAASAREVLPDSSKNEKVYSHFVNAMILERRGDLQKALEEYDRTLDLDPSATVILRHRANLRLKMGDSEKALADAEAYVKEHPKEVEGLELLSNIQLALGRVDDAEQTLETLLKQDTGNADALLTLAGLVMPDNPSAARNLLKKLIQVRPDAGEGYYYLGLLEQKQGNSDKAKALFEKVIQVDPESLPALVLLGQMSENAGDAEAALRYYGKALDLNPDNLALRMQMILLHAKRLEFDQVESLLEPFKEDPDAPVEANLWLGIVNENKKDWRQALKYYRRADKQMDNPELLLRLASLYSQVGEPRKALDTLDRLVKKDPDNPQYRYFLGLAYVDLKKPRAAVREFDRALALRPDFSQALFQKGVAYDAMKDWPQAEKCFRETIRVDSAAASAYNYLGYTYADRNIDLPQAKALVTKALQLEPDNPAYMDSLGWVYYKEGNYQAALKQLQPASEKLADPVIFDHLGDCYRALGDLSNAAVSYARAVELDPKDRAAGKKLEELNHHLVPTSPARSLLYRFRSNLWHARQLSGMIFVRAKGGVGALFPAGGSQGLFYFSNGQPTVGATRMRVDLGESFVSPTITLRYQNLPSEQWRVFPPEVESRMPPETEMILGTVASFLDGRMIDVFDSTETVVTEKRNYYILRRGDSEMRIGKKDALPSEIRVPNRTVVVDEFRKTGEVWLPEKLRLSWSGPERTSPLREIRIEFPKLSLDEIENGVFEAEKEPESVPRR